MKKIRRDGIIICLRYILLEEFCSKAVIGKNIVRLVFNASKLEICKLEPIARHYWPVAGKGLGAVNKGA